MKELIILGSLLLAIASASLEEHGYAPHHGYGSANLVDLGEHLDLSHHLKHEYPAGILFGHGYISGIHAGGSGGGGFGGQHGSPAINVVSSAISDSFTTTLLAPELPKLQPVIQPQIGIPQHSIQQFDIPQVNIPQAVASPRYPPRITNTPTQTYEVKEENYEPVPVPRISTPTAILPQKPISLGSGSLGLSQLGNGNYALGSGSLGYIGAQQISTGSSAAFGLQEVSAPALGSAQAFAVGDSHAAIQPALGISSPFAHFNALQDFVKSQ